MHRIFVAALLVTASTVAAVAQVDGDPTRGKRAFLKCAACHSADPKVHKTGPSLARIWEKKAATVKGFSRYSDALQDSDIVWNEETLDRLLRNPEALVPGTSMKMRGITNATERRDIIAYLKQLASGTADQTAASKQKSARPGGMMGMMGASEPTDISQPPPGQQVISLRHCRDAYEVVTADDELRKFWEFNLRVKTDTSDMGPPEGTPVLLPAGMRGDRAFVIFAAPKAMSGFIEEKC